MSQRKATKPPSDELQPLKIVGQLIGARYNAEGQIIGEAIMGDVAIYRPSFDKVEEIIEKAVAEAREAA